ncbi:hypothetical protein L1987_23817 [Smallanthus sonchifolius]|uniref:Uncharacterized protein n=1 Tax=Smallanthus sonchifolius TaxID=185202 RepID=A0ACB9IK68_9ASTR|nr:hypothetical protein L1987_23817 [Smallanthus sonchifolius]
MYNQPPERDTYRDRIQAIGRSSHKMIEAIMQSASKGKGSGTQISAQRNSSELGHGLLSRWLSSHHHGGGGVHDEKSVAHHTVNLLTSTIKAESTLDQMDWIEKITWVIASLLSSQVNPYTHQVKLCDFGSDIVLGITNTVSYLQKEGQLLLR